MKLNLTDNWLYSYFIYLAIFEKKSSDSLEFGSIKQAVQLLELVLIRSQPGQVIFADHVHQGIRNKKWICLNKSFSANGLMYILEHVKCFAASCSI